MSPPDPSRTDSLEPIPEVNPWLGEEESAAVARVVATRWITEGPSTAEFGDALKALIGAPYGVFAPNGTLALALGLMALGLRQGEEVLVPDTTFIGSATAVMLAGGVPVFVEVEPETFQIDTAKAKECLSARTRVIMPVHLYGTGCDMDAVVAFADCHGLRIVEDAAQGIGVTYGGRHVGSIGDIGCFSFFADKTITTGEGGFVACKDADVYDRLRYLRNQGRLERGSFVHPMIGFNFRITDLQAAIGLEQMKKLPKIIARKREWHEVYRELLAGVEEVRLLGAARGANLVPFRVVLIAERASALMDFLAVNGVQSRSFFYPLHRQPCFAKDAETLQMQDTRYPVAIHGYDHGVCLPVSPVLTRDQIDRIASLVKRFYTIG